MIRRSLSAKMIAVFSAILVAVVALNIVINALLLTRVHRKMKIGSMEELYFSISKAYEEKDDDDEVIDLVKESLANHNLRVFVWDSKDNLIIDSLPLSRKDNKTFEDKESDERKEEPFNREFPSTNRDFRHDFRFDRNNEFFIMNIDVPKEHVISSNDEYTLFSVETFQKTDEENICLRGDLANGYRVLIQMPVASIEEAVYASNMLLLTVGAVMLLIGIIIVALTSKTVAKPVKELSDIASSMTNLDFSVKYVSNRKDEIGQLGKSIDLLSEKLEQTIGELFEKNERLEKDIELKSKIDTMRKEFIANASHELKTPVALIRGYAEGLGDNIISDEESRKIYTDVIIEEADKMDYIIRQMLEMMEIDATDSILNAQKFSLSLLVEEVIDSFEVILNSKKIRLDFASDGEYNIEGDRYKIHQAVTNYISNAVNHVDDNKDIRVKIRKIDDKIEFSVYNSGNNIPESEFEAIWERFYKVDKAHSRQYGGTGLGLSIVKSVVQLHGGQYGVRNTDDGVEFYFILNEEISDET